MEYAAALEQQMAERQRPRHHASAAAHEDASRGSSILTGGGGEHELAAKRRQQMEYAQALEDQMAARNLKERTVGGAFTLGHDDEQAADARRGQREAYAQELAQQVAEQRDRKAAEKARFRAEQEGRVNVFGQAPPVDSELPPPTATSPTAGGPQAGGRRQTTITRPENAPDLVAARVQQQNEMQAALAEQVAQKQAEKKRRQQMLIEEEKKELVKLERERQEMREQFEREQAERRRKEQEKADKARGGGTESGEPPAKSQTPQGGGVGGATGGMEGRRASTCLTYDERMAQRAEEYHRRQEEREKAEASNAAPQTVAEPPPAENTSAQQGRRRGASRPGSVHRVNRPQTEVSVPQSNGDPVEIERINAASQQMVTPQQQMMAPQQQFAPQPQQVMPQQQMMMPHQQQQQMLMPQQQQLPMQMVTPQGMMVMIPQNMPQQQAQPAVMELPEEAKRELAQLKKLQAELQEAQAEQTRKAQEQQAQLQAAQVAQMEELRRQNEELRTAMAAQYDRLQEEQNLMHQKMAAELADQPVAAQEELQRKMAEQYERLQHEQEMMQQRLEGQQRLVAGALNQQGDTAQASLAPLPRLASRRPSLPPQAAPPPPQAPAQSEQPTTACQGGAATQARAPAAARQPAPPSRANSALSESVLRTPYLDPTYDPPQRPELPVPPPEVEAALARLQMPGVATAAVAGELSTVDRGWSPLIEPSAEDRYRSQLGALQAPGPHPALRGPVLADAEAQTSLQGAGTLRASLRGASELVYPSDDTLRRSLEAQEAGREIAVAQASQRINSAGRLGIPAPLPTLVESDEIYGRGPGSRPRTQEGVNRPGSAGRRPGSAPTQVPSLDLQSMQSNPPSTPGLDTLVRRAEERLRQLQLTELTPDPVEKASPSVAARVMAADAAALGDGTMRAGTLRASLPAESEYVPIGKGSGASMHPKIIPDGDLPVWLQPPNTYGGRPARGVDGGKEESREALISRGSNVSNAESTTVSIARRTEQQHQRLKDFEAHVAHLNNAEFAAGNLPEGHPSTGQAALSANLPPPSPQEASKPGDTTAGVEERLEWLRQLESQLGVEGVVIPRNGDDLNASPGGGHDADVGGHAAAAVATEGPSRPKAFNSARGGKRHTLPVKSLHPDTYDVEERVQQLDQKESSAKEKEELDGLLERYLQMT